MRMERRRVTRWLIVAALPLLILGIVALPSSFGTRAATAPPAVSTAVSAGSTAVNTAKPAVSTAVSTAQGAASTAGAITSTGTAQSGGALPVAIHDGTCTNPTTQPTDQLGNLKLFGGESAATAMATNVATIAAMGSPAAGTPGQSVLSVQKTIDTNLDDLVAANHPRAIVLHESATNYTHYLACGSLTGQPQVDGKAVIPLFPASGSDWYGIAVLENTKSTPVVGSNETRVTVYMFQAQAGAVATPAS